MKFGYSLGNRERCGAVADSPSGHRIGFRHSVDDYDPVLDLREGGKRGCRADIGDVLIDLVSDDDDVRVPCQDIHKALELFLAVNGSGRIAWGTDQDSLGLRGYGRFELLRSHLELLLRAGIDEDRNALCDLDHLHVAHPGRDRDEDFLSFVHNGKDHIAEFLLRSVSDNDLCRSEIQAVLPLEFAAYRLTEGKVAGNRCVEREVVVNGLLGRFLDVVRGVEIRFSHAEADDIEPGSLEIGCLLGHGKSR